MAQNWSEVFQSGKESSLVKSHLRFPVHFPCSSSLTSKLQPVSSCDIVEAGHRQRHKRSVKLRHLEELRKGFTTLTASAFPVLTILALYYIEPTVHRIYLALGFTLGFGLLLKVSTNCGLREVFMACAA